MVDETGTAIGLRRLFGMCRLIAGAIVGGCVEANVWFIGAMAVEETSGGLVIPVATVGKAALRVVVRR